MSVGGLTCTSFLHDWAAHMQLPCPAAPGQGFTARWPWQARGGRTLGRQAKLHSVESHERGEIRLSCVNFKDIS